MKALWLETVTALIALTFLVCAPTIFAVVPLVTDDADPVDFEHLQLSSGFQYNQMTSAKLFEYSINPVFGITPRSELGVAFGYQWFNGKSHTDGITDVTVETKWRLLGRTDDNFKLSTRFDLKWPTASKQLGLGTGKPDADAILIATYCLGNTYLDSDVGYTAVDAANSHFADDCWFLGQAIRQPLNNHWTLIGDAYATFSQGNNDAPVNFNFEGGAQFVLRDNLLLSILVGAAIGRNSPDLTSYWGLTWTF